MFEGKIVRVHNFSLGGAIDALFDSPVVGPLPRIGRMTDDLQGVRFGKKGREKVAIANCVDESRVPGQRVIISEL